MPDPDSADPIPNATPDKNFYGEVDRLTATLDQKERLDALLTAALILLDDYETKKASASDAWKKVEAAQDILEREMKRQGVKSFRGLTSSALETIVDKKSCEYEPTMKPSVLTFLRQHNGEGLITETIRKDTLAKWLQEFAERGGRIPEFIELCPASFIQIRR